jgi:hypothetical protein
LKLNYELLGLITKLQWSHFFSEMEMKIAKIALSNESGFQWGRFFSEMEIGYLIGPVPALDLSSICEHLPFLPRNTSEISVFQGHFQYVQALRAPPGVLGIIGVLAKDLIYKSFGNRRDYGSDPSLCWTAPAWQGF